MKWHYSDVNATINISYDLVKNQNIDFEKLENSVNKCIEIIRITKYGSLDLFIILIINKLKTKFEFFHETEEFINFRIPPSWVARRAGSETINYFEDLRFNNISLESIIDKSKYLCKSSLNNTYEMIQETLRKIYDTEDLLTNLENLGNIVEKLELKNPNSNSNFELEINSIIDSSKNSKTYTKEDIKNHKDLKDIKNLSRKNINIKNCERRQEPRKIFP